jgi:hypothetical protein
MKRIIFATAFGLAISATSAQAQTQVQSIESADVFYSACKASENLNLCAMYLSGFTTGVYAQNYLDKGAIRYCLPSGTTHKQNIDTVLRYLDANPSERKQPTGVVMYMALAKAHPCK